MTIDRGSFRVLLRALTSLDRPDLEAVGLFVRNDNWKYASGSVDYEWTRFCDNPSSYLANASDDDADKIFMALLRKTSRDV